MRQSNVHIMALTACLCLAFACKPSLRDPDWKPTPSERMISWFKGLNYAGHRGTTSYDLGYPHWYINRQFDLPVMTREAVELGRFLFYDKSLSSDSTVACAKCHQQKFSFTDQKRFSVGVKGRVGKRNAMQLLNLHFDQRFFWDGRASSLEEQVLMPIQDSNEMDLPLAELVERLKKHPVYPELFERAYNTKVITEKLIADALAQFVRSIISYSTADDYLRAYFDRIIGYDMVPAAAKKLEPIYKKNVKIMNCGACHIISLQYGQNRFDDVGLEAEPKDVGYFSVTGKEEDKGKFKVPTLRNIAVTAPYMHDGRFETIEAVIDHYRKGMVRKANMSPFYLDNNKKIKTESITDDQVRTMIEGLKIHYDEKVLTDPKYSDPF